MEKTLSSGDLVKSGRAQQIQFLRFLAFLNIYIAHAEVYLFFRYPASHCAAAAVSFFFMLSGLVSSYSLYGREIRLGWREQGAFLWKKVKKVYPLYFLTSAFCFLFYVLPGILTSGNLEQLENHTWPVLANLLMIQTWVKVDSYNAVAWFLATLMFLYPVVLPGMAVLNKMGKRKCTVIWLGAAFFLLMVWITGYCRVTWPYDMEYWQYHLPLGRLTEFLMGMILGYGVRYVAPYVERWKLGKILPTLLEIAVLCFWVFSLRRAGNYWMNRIISWIIPNTLLLGVFAFGKGWISDVFRWKPLVRLGDISFTCFLVHNILIVRYVLNNPGLPETLLGKAVPFMTCLVLTVMISELLSPKSKK